jgi:DUF1365 family protein
VTAATLYRTQISHARSEGAEHGFTYRHVMWLVDLDDLPSVPRLLRPLLRFDACDHLGDPDASIRRNVEAFLTTHGIDLGGGRIRMLANPRSLGHAFNPLTVYWCDRADGTPACIVAEVHNTRGDRHSYLLRPDAAGRSTVAKKLWVSPFFAVDGAYDIRCSAPGDHLQMSIVLRRGTVPRPVFAATLTGYAERPAPSVAAAAFRHPWSSWRVSALIHWQGLRLWLRRLPVVPRPAPTLEAAHR